MLCVLTSRYTGAAESQVEKDIRRFAEAENGEQFLATIDQIISANLTPDFWEVTLPDQLSWSGGNVPSMFAYFASLNLLGAKVLFSTMTVHELLDPANAGKKQSMNVITSSPRPTSKEKASKEHREPTRLQMRSLNGLTTSESPTKLQLTTFHNYSPNVFLPTNNSHSVSGMHCPKVGKKWNTTSSCRNAKS